MPQLHLSVPERVASEVHRRALAEGMSVSRYLARVVIKELSDGWPDGYFDRVVGAWQGHLERSPQGKPEKRDRL